MFFKKKMKEEFIKCDDCNHLVEKSSCRIIKYEKLMSSVLSSSLVIDQYLCRLCDVPYDKVIQVEPPSFANPSDKGTYRYYKFIPSHYQEVNQKGFPINHEK